MPPRGSIASRKAASRLPPPAAASTAPPSPAPISGFRPSAMDWLNILIQGALLGGLYALFAIGLALSFGIMRLVNIAHGDFIVLAAYIALALIEATGIGALAGLVIVVPLMFAFGYALQRGILN